MYEAVFIVMDKDGKRAYTGYQAARIYTRKHDAVAKCPRGGQVLRFELKGGEVVHEEQQ
jgi:hypothetical protein